MSNPTNNPTNTVKKVLNSTFLIMLVCLVAFDIAISQFHPLKSVHVKDFIPVDQNPVISKVPEFLSSHEKTNVLLLGSSLPMTAVAQYDHKFCGTPKSTSITSIRTYTQAKYLESLLSAKFHKPASIFNLTCAGCMTSDVWIILAKTIAEQKAPKTVIYGLAPRDFIDRTVQPIGMTPAFEVLDSWISVQDLTENVQHTASEFVSERVNHWQNHSGTFSLISEINSSSKSLSTVIHKHSLDSQSRDFLISRLWYFYRVRADYKFFLSSVASDLFNHPISLYDAVTKKPSESAGGGTAIGNLLSSHAGIMPEERDSFDEQAFQKDLLVYDKRYNPADFDRFEKEMAYFKQFAQLCQSHHISCVIINMPITAENKALIDTKMYSQYYDQIKAICSTYGLKFVDMDQLSMFPHSDFSDSVHLNSTGGKKFQDLLVNNLDNINL